jgi:glutamate synthase domain-containing protein 2
MPLPTRNGLLGLAQAAAALETIAVIDPDEWAADLLPYQHALAPRLSSQQQINLLPAGWQPRYLEIDDPDPLPLVAQARARWPEAVIAVYFPFTAGAADEAVSLVRAGVVGLHFEGDEMGMDADGARHLPQAIRAVHERLVAECLRDQVSLVVSGGIAAADHVAKAIACGADALGVDWITLIAWGTSLWADRGPSPVESGDFDPAWAAQRLVNLMNAWRDQLLEALGAMGMREVRRLRGEIGRTIWYETEEKKFRAVLGDSVPHQHYKLLRKPEAAEGDFRWPTHLLLSTRYQAHTGRAPQGNMEYRVGESDGGFDRLAFQFELEKTGEIHKVPHTNPTSFDLSLPLNRRVDNRPAIVIPSPWYGAGMSYGSIGLPVMLARARAAQAMNSFMSTGEGGYPDELTPYSDHIITQVATGLFGVREDTMQRARILEIKYAQGSKPGLGGHLLGNKNTESVARIREAVQGTSLFSPFPFHSVYSVEDHKKHVDWLKQVNPQALISVKVSTPTDIDMVAVGSFYAGAHIIHLDGAYGGTGAAPEISKKNIAMPIEYALPKVHRFLKAEGIRDEITLIASGGLRTAFDVAKAIALGADGVVLGTAELVAIGCIRIAQCEKGLGCPFGITTTDPEHAAKIDADVGYQKIVNMYNGWLWQIAGILEMLGMKSISELRGRSDLLVYLT